jgi:TatD DNase family protein
LSYFNVHTHRKPLNNNEICIRNAYLKPVKKITANYFLSTGLHPWFVRDFSEVALISVLNENILDTRVIAIGEIGLDSTKPNFSKQKELFKVQLDFAEKNNLPIIVHLVKSAQDFIPIIKPFKCELILHGFKDGIEMWKQLNPNGKTNVSIGKHVFTKSKKLTGLIEQIPKENLFIETDQSKYSIMSIYEEISKIRGISVEELEYQICQNFRRVFKKY